MAELLDELKAQYAAIRERERQAQEKAKGDQLTVERVRVENEARSKDTPPAERLFDGIRPDIADRLRNPEAERQKAIQQEQEREKPTKMEYKPTGLQPGPSLGGGIVSPQPVRAAGEIERQPDKLTISTFPARDGSGKDPLPHERLAAQLQKAPERDLLAEVRARRAAQAEIDRSREQQQGMQRGRDRGH